MGRNGAGKSSLMWALQGATPSSGTVSVLDQEASPDDRRPPRSGQWADPRTVDAKVARRLVTLVPQSAADLLYLPTVAAECHQADMESEVPPGTTTQILTSLGAHLPGGRNPRDLSEGQRLALVLAIQLSARPDVVLLDEPTRGLDLSLIHI